MASGPYCMHTAQVNSLGAKLVLVLVCWLLPCLKHRMLCPGQNSGALAVSMRVQYWMTDLGMQSVHWPSTINLQVVTGLGTGWSRCLPSVHVTNDKGHHVQGYSKHALPGIPWQRCQNQSQDSLHKRQRKSASVSQGDHLFWWFPFHSTDYTPWWKHLVPWWPEGSSGWKGWGSEDHQWQELEEL